jgi:hypothetical protein
VSPRVRYGSFLGRRPGWAGTIDGWWGIRRAMGTGSPAEPPGTTSVGPATSGDVG